MKIKNCKIGNFYQPGFTFVEVIVSIFIFSLVISTATAVFAKVVLSYRRSKEIQRNLESAQQAMNYMAKSLRTSTVKRCWQDDGSLKVDCVAVSGRYFTSILVYDYSQGKCIMYGINGDYLYQQDGTADKSLCGINSQLGFQKRLIDGHAIGRFNVVKSSSAAGSEAVGKVTLQLDVCEVSGGSCDATKDKASIQTTVSLRDYTESGM